MTLIPDGTPIKLVDASYQSIVSPPNYGQAYLVFSFMVFVYIMYRNFIELEIKGIDIKIPKTSRTVYLDIDNFLDTFMVFPAVYLFGMSLGYT